jgi:hypothetical protein
MTTIISDKFGNIEYRLNGKLYRDNEPARICSDGSQE